MGLESGSFLDDLVATNPAGTDGKSQGDDHLRLIKKVLKATFIGATRAFHFPAAPGVKTGTFSVQVKDQNSLIRGDMSSGAFTITLPLGSTVFPGWEITIMKSDSSSNLLTVDGKGSETINGSADRTLNTQYFSETYRWEGSEWKVVSSSDFIFKKGTDIASASPLVIGTDGNYFEVTGTNNFSIMTVAANRHFFLQFTDALLMTHDSTNLDLPGELDITTAAGDIMFCFATGSDTVQVLFYTQAGDRNYQDRVLQRPGLKDYGEVTNVLSGTGDKTVDLVLGNSVTHTAFGAITWTFTGATAAPSLSGFTLSLITGGIATQTWPTNLKWAGGTEPTLANNTATFTTDFAADNKLDITAHGFHIGERVHVTTSSALPGGLSADTIYFIINKTTNDFELSETLEGSAVSITDDGSGTQTLHSGEDKLVFETDNGGTYWTGSLSIADSKIP